MTSFAKNLSIHLLRYNIDHKGKVTSSKILSSLGHGCDEEAQRIVKKFEFEIPKGPRKLKIKFHKTIKIHFRLPKESTKKIEVKPQNNQTQITYSIKPTTKPPTPPQKPKGYSYTIKF